VRGGGLRIMNVDDEVGEEKIEDIVIRATDEYRRVVRREKSRKRILDYIGEAMVLGTDWRERNLIIRFSIHPTGIIRILKMRRTKYR
jgi:hypothetical protein